MYFLNLLSFSILFNSIFLFFYLIVSFISGVDYHTYRCIFHFWCRLLCSPLHFSFVVRITLSTIASSFPCANYPLLHPSFLVQSTMPTIASIIPSADYHACHCIHLSWCGLLCSLLHFLFLVWSLLAILFTFFMVHLCYCYFILLVLYFYYCFFSHLCHLRLSRILSLTKMLVYVFTHSLYKKLKGHTP